MAHITSARIRKAESLCRRQAARFRREHGDMTRAQVKKNPELDAATKFRESLTKDLLKDLAESYPDDGFSHDGETLKASAEDGFMWHINGLGGFDNFLRAKEDFYQLFVLTRDGKPVECFGYMPLSDEISLAVRNNGATGYGARLRVSGRKNLDGSSIHLNTSSAASAVGKIAQAGADVRVTGSYLTDILDLCAGRADGFFAAELPHTEALFAQLMVTESGGSTTSDAGKTFIAGNNDCFYHLKKLTG